MTPPAGGKRARTPDSVRHWQSDPRTARTGTSAGGSPLTEWDLLSYSSRDEIEQLVEILKAVKQGDFTVRLPYQKEGILGRADERPMTSSA